MRISRGVAFTILPFCACLAILDFYLSMQTFVGAMGARTIDLIFGITLGLGLTGLLICMPLVKVGYPTFAYRITWVLVVAGDVATNLAGAIWYGAMKSDLKAPIVISDIRIKSDNLYLVVVWGLVTLVLTLACIQLGHSIDALQTAGGSGPEGGKDPGPTSATPTTTGERSSPDEAVAGDGAYLVEAGKAPQSPSVKEVEALRNRLAELEGEVATLLKAAPSVPEVLDREPPATEKPAPAPSASEAATAAAAAGTPGEAGGPESR